MEREKVLFRTTGKANVRKILLAVGFYGVPIALGLAAYLIFSKQYQNKAKKENTKENGKLNNSSKKQTPSKRIKKGMPPGLINLGNTCFINCLLQGLASLSGFLKWMDALKKDKDKILQDSLQDMLKVLTNRKETEHDVSTAADIVECLRAHGWVITSEQQDTHEFFQVLLSTLDEEMDNSNHEKHQFGFQSDVVQSKMSIIGKVSQYFPARTIETQCPFKGMLANRMSCNECSHKSVKFEPFESISLRIPQLSALTGATLERCLADFVSSEKVDGVECPKCTAKSFTGQSVKTSFKKQLSFAKLPNCLCIHIQRSYFLSNGTAYKNSQFVRFTDILDLQPYRYNTVAYNDVTNAISMPLRGGSYQSTARQPAALTTRSLYRLKSVIVHIGDVLDGHFVTYRRAIGTEDNWVYASDEHIKTATKQSVLSNTAYLLFYERTNDIMS